MPQKFLIGGADSLSLNFVQSKKKNEMKTFLFFNNCDLFKERLVIMQDNCCSSNFIAFALQILLCSVVLVIKFHA